MLESHDKYDPIELNFNCEEYYKSVVERYYVKHFKIDYKNQEDICILEHSNRICIVTLASSHPIIRLKKNIVNIDFQADENINRLNNKVSGRLKRGAQWINGSQPFCHISCDDGTRYTICTGMKGSLVEVNENLLTYPQLILNKPDTDGYIAILLTRIDDHKKEMSKLDTNEKYHEILLQREKIIT